MSLRTANGTLIRRSSYPEALSNDKYKQSWFFLKWILCDIIKFHSLRSHVTKNQFVRPGPEFAVTPEESLAILYPLSITMVQEMSVAVKYIVQKMSVIVRTALTSPNYGL